MCSGIDEQVFFFFFFFSDKNTEKHLAVQQPLLGDNMEDDEVNLLSENDVAKLGLMTVTAEENEGYCNKLSI